ncbi:MAG: hypothetical protein COB60_07955 [Flavobacteriaceae bacterium]|nr:MAG: hypothetical protein COB60_07955 [Flavobacteriaceae bacterium]
MKIIKMKQLFYLVFAGILVFSCSEDEYTPYSPDPLADNDGAISYTNMTSYPIVGNIVSQEPEYTVDGAYKFGVHEVVAPNGSTFKLANFSIDNLTGVINYTNEGELSPGSYNVTVSVGHVNGLAVYDNAYVLTVSEVPVVVNIDKPAVDAGIFQTGVVAIVSYTDTSESGLITDVEYTLVDAPSGFSINKNSGEISKSDAATSGKNSISVKITTNLGAITETNICIVTVGEAPTIEYVQTDGNTPLTNVTMSPWTAYTTAAPNLVGMIATSYDIIFPSELVDGSVVANADGTISVLADQNLAIGTHSLGVKVTNAGGNEVVFEDVFTITVENRWEAMDLFNDTFDDGSTGNIAPGNGIYPSYSGYTLGGSSSWNKAVINKTGLPTIEGIRVQDPGTSDHYLVKSLDITGVKAMRISFSEQLGYNANFVDAHNRRLYVGESTTDLDNDSFDVSNWTEVMADNDPRWSGSSTWASRVPSFVNNIDIDLSAISGSTLKINWFLGTISTAQKGQYIIDSCKAQYTAAFPAEEM